jgi:bifunctional UDP-N-acetylglucosamine pyrophosphorylase/glucosamine-1-phosphate N-acetyltransferase
MAVKAIVLAAGAGTRMKSPIPKVVHEIAGRPLVDWVLRALKGAQATRTVVVIGTGAEQVRDVLPDSVETAVQDKQLGTGHATEIGLASLRIDPGDQVIVAPGDTPLLTAHSIAALLEVHTRTEAAATCLTARVADATGYGRILRDVAGGVVGIVEHKDATPSQLALDEINSGVYAFDASLLREALIHIDTDNSQGEFYLTDVLAVLNADGHPITAFMTAEEEIAGVNSQSQLAAAAEVVRARLADELMEHGVWMQDPSTVYIDAAVTVEPGARIRPNVHLAGETWVASGADVGPDVFAVNSTIGEGARVWYSVLRSAEVGDHVEVGPYASLRPGARLESGSKAGTFVEMKNTTVRAGAKVPHLSYMGDADIGEGANIGAGTITCNYDGYNKHKTVIGKDAFIGSDTMLVAPISIGEGAVTGAGSTITSDVEAGALAVERSPQTDIPGYAARRHDRAEAAARESADEG